MKEKKIHATATLTVGCYYALCGAPGEHQSICERSFVNVFFCEVISYIFLWERSSGILCVCAVRACVRAYVCVCVCVCVCV